MTRSDHDRPVRVLVPYRRLRSTTNPYVAQLHRALESTPGVEVVPFSHRRAVLGGYDVVHLHWPETLLVADRPATRAARRLVALALVARLALLRVPLVRTVHNLDVPSGLGRLDRAWLRVVDQLTTVRVAINDTTPRPEGQEWVVVPHGHYRDWFADVARQPARAGLLAYAGLVRRYKNVDGLVQAFREAVDADPTLRLHVAGAPSSDELAAQVRTAAADHPSVELQLRFLDDDELAAVITSAELVVLPYRHMHNSGTALLALSLDRPVLVPGNPTTRALAAEVGPGWVHTFDGDLDGVDLLRAVDAVRGPRSARPDLSGREWAEAGAAHLAAYRHALHLRRGGTPARREPAVPDPAQDGTPR